MGERALSLALHDEPAGLAAAEGSGELEADDVAAAPEPETLSCMERKTPTEGERASSAAGESNSTTRPWLSTAMRELSRIVFSLCTPMTSARVSDADASLRGDRPVRNGDDSGLGKALADGDLQQRIRLAANATRVSVRAA